MTSIFVNLPVADVAAARAFYTGLGYAANEQYSGDQSACMVINDAVNAMLLSGSHFRRTTGSCTCAASPTSTATTGSWPPRCHDLVEGHGLSAGGLGLGARMLRATRHALVRTRPSSPPECLEG
jgi:hypothetical protein